MQIFYQATTSLTVDKRRKKKQNKYPIKLRLTYLRKQKYYATGYDLTPKEIEKVFSKKPREKYKKIMLELHDIEKRALEVIERLDKFSFPAFEKEFLNPGLREDDVYAAYQRTIERLKHEERVGMAHNYRDSMNSFKKFTKRLSFEDVTVEFLYNYERWMTQQGRSYTTIGIYIRTLRTMVNEAINNGIIGPEDYPFGRHKYQIPNGRNVKKALTLEEVEKIYNYQPKLYSSEDKAKDFWLFSYYCNGLNMTDIANLEYHNLDGDRIVFIRAKTARSNRQDQKFITAVLVDDAKRIIKKWGHPERENNFIFPIIDNTMNAERQKAVIKQFTKNINKWIQRIADNVGILKKVTTYSARHSFSTILKRAGASTEFISEQLGHTNLKTTENYLDSFENEVKKQFAQKLVDFKSKDE